jgi:hypothetical protein
MLMGVFSLLLMLKSGLRTNYALNA